MEIEIMASSVATQKFHANNRITQSLSGDKTTAAAVTWLDMRDYRGLSAVINLAVLGGNGVEAFQIIADSDSDGGSGSNVVIKTHATPTTADAAGDMLVLECTMDEVRHLAESNSVELRYLAVKLETHHASDQVVVTHIQHGARWARLNLTADVVAA
jgi:hypothetical protein